MNIIGGVDEAGRGPVLGPLIICSAFCNRLNEKKLNKLGKKDSKQLSPTQREERYTELKKFCQFKVAEITAEELNKLMKTMSLNDIEAKYMADLIRKQQTESDIMIDMPDRYSWTFRNRMQKFGVTKFEAEHKADETYPIVAAASICAKVTRDKKIEEIKTETGVDFGSGYPADPKTKTTLIDPAKRKIITKYIRWEWKTLENLKQRKLFEGEEDSKNQSG